MTDHVDREIAELVAGRLSPARAREVEEHLKRCDECATDVAWAHELRQRATREGLRHVEPMRVVEIASGVEPTAIEGDHLGSCARCRAEVAWAAAAPAEDADEEPPAPPGRSPWAWAGLVAAASLAAFLFFPRGEETDFGGLARIEPLPVRITRAVPETGSSAESRMRGLEAYASGDWTAARESLARAVELEPGNTEALLYLGSAELLAGDIHAAAATLDRALAEARDVTVHDEAAWQRAQAALREQDPDRARALLDELAGREGRRQTAARAQLDALGKAR